MVSSDHIKAFRASRDDKSKAVFRVALPRPHLYHILPERKRSVPSSRGAWQGYETNQTYRRHSEERMDSGRHRGQHYRNMVLRMPHNSPQPAATAVHNRIKLFLL